jgi:Creatinine amidohydrolase
MNTLSWVEYQSRLQEKDLVLFLPCGALEQHGPHLPLGTDGILSGAIAQAVAERVNGLVRGRDHTAQYPAAAFATEWLTSLKDLMVQHIGDDDNAIAQIYFLVNKVKFRISEAKNGVTHNGVTHKSNRWF